MHELHVRRERLGERLQVLLGELESGKGGEALHLLDCHSRIMSYQEIVEQLLHETGASRTTLRLDSPDAFFAVVAEARAPGIRSIADDTSIDLAGSPTFKFLERDQDVLIQSDLLDADPAPPPELIEHYGARAQMLAPIVRDGRLVGIVSVHYAPGPREWTEDDIAALERAAGTVQDNLAP